MSFTIHIISVQTIRGLRWTSKLGSCEMASSQNVQVFTWSAGILRVFVCFPHKLINPNCKDPVIFGGWRCSGQRMRNTFTEWQLVRGNYQRVLRKQAINAALTLLLYSESALMNTSICFGPLSLKWALIAPLWNWTALIDSLTSLVMLWTDHILFCHCNLPQNPLWMHFTFALPPSMHFFTSFSKKGMSFSSKPARDCLSNVLCSRRLQHSPNFVGKTHRRRWKERRVAPVAGALIESSPLDFVKQLGNLSVKWTPRPNNIARRKLKILKQELVLGMVFPCLSHL